MDPSPDPSIPSARPRTRRSLRVRIACLRCQRRKIKCDGVVPSCGSCSKAGVECVDGGNADGINSPRTYISSLKSRVQWLESIIRTKCPDVDLTQGPKVLDESGQRAVADGTDSTPGNFSLPTPQSVSIIEDGSFPGPAQSSSSINVQPAQQLPSVANDQQAGLAHEIGLVSLSAGTDPKYIGPSSGYFFAKLLLACARQSQRNAPSQEVQQNAETTLSRLFPQGTLSIPPVSFPESMEYAIQISKAYFDSIHLQYPFLHQPSHMKLVEHVYREAEPSPNAAFQVYMVLGIGSTVLSRRLKISLPGDGFCASAMKYFDKLCIENSLKGLQSLLLLLVYTLSSPAMGLNVWYLNYQCIAALLDLGLQRDVRSGKHVSVLDQELRTRMFWVIYSLDRSVATMMGRPIGLRDEACELRLPADVDDNKLSINGIQPRLETESPTHMTNAIYLFKLSQLNSEMKYILHSISHNTPSYTYPSIPNILQWQNDMKTRLREWFDQIPQFNGDRIYMTKLCEIKYHDIMMLLLRPSPAIPNPSTESLTSCYESAIASLRLYDQLYRKDLLVYSWVTIHSIFLSTITMLHCIWTVPEVTAQVKLDVLTSDLKSGSNVLSATGEHWSEARRSRNVLDELSATTIRWIMESRTQGASNSAPTRRVLQRETRSSANNGIINIGSSQDSSTQYSTAQPYHNRGSEFNLPEGNDLQDGAGYDSLFNMPLFGDDNFTDQFDFSDPAAVNTIMQGLFTDFQPVYDFGQDFGMDQIMGGQP